MSRRLILGLAASALLAAAPEPVRAQKSADTLRIALRDAVTNIDPYYNNLRTGLIMAHHGWDTLIHRDPTDFSLKPLLATEWKLVDPTTLEFTLRQGVKFHDGTPLTADDVVYTFNLVSNPDSKVSTPSNVAWVAMTEKVSDLVVRVKMKAPTPAALEYIAFTMPIYPKAYRERVGAEGYAKAPIGAGPYRIASWEAGKSVEFERFEDYYAGSPKGKPAIKKLSVRFVPDAATELTELLAQRVDWIWNLNPDQFDNVNKVPFLTAIRKESMRIGYLQIDAAGRDSADSPLKNLKVRQAIFHAINRQEIADKLVTGGSRVPPAPCFPPQFGCIGEAAVQYPFDPAKAKSLLAEAGYPNGLDLDLVTYILPQWGAAVQGYLNAVGIRARLAQLQVQAAIQRNREGKSPLNLGSWGSFSINDVSAILPNFFNGGPDDYARDAELTKLVLDAGATNDAAARKAGYSAAIKRITEQAYWVPLHTYVTTYGHSKAVAFTPWSDEMPRWFMSKWN
jgi:peptide/nickel transport system substrate-binding protein